MSFARSLYCSADITLLDDPLSAVDAHTCEHLWSKGVKGMLKNAKKTTLGFTHQVRKNIYICSLPAFLINSLIF